jgi:hypothetical protein
LAAAAAHQNDIGAIRVGFRHLYPTKTSRIVVLATVGSWLPD